MRLERENEKEYTIYDLIRWVFGNTYVCLIIKKKEDKRINVFDYANSFIFNLSMNENQNYILVDGLQDFFEKRYVSRIHSSSINNDIPYKKYNREIVRYYLDANSSVNPKIAFLSYYNVLEYFFDKIYIDEKCQIIQNIITSPRFNHGKLSDYKQVLEALDIKKANKLGKVQITETESLKLLIKKYIDIDSFKSFLQRNTYYLEKDAHKVQNTKFELNDNDDSFIGKICNRVYKVRNGLVHSKDGEDIKYIPYKDEKYISKEIPLIKYLSEEIIINTSEII